MVGGAFQGEGCPMLDNALESSCLVFTVAMEPKQ